MAAFPYAYDFFAGRAIRRFVIVSDDSEGHPAGAEVGVWLYA